jgi:hypothetical protein
MNEQELSQYLEMERLAEMEQDIGDQSSTP